MTRKQIARPAKAPAKTASASAKGAPFKAAPASSASKAPPARSVIEVDPAPKGTTPRIPQPVASVVATAPHVEATPVAEPIKTIALPENSAEIEKGTPEMVHPAAASAEKIQVLFSDLNDRAKTAIEKGTRMGEEITALTKGNLEAVAESARIAAKGAESIAQDAAEYGKRNFENATATMKRYSAVKSPVELFQLNSEIAKTSFDSAVAEASKFSETLTKLAGEFFQPLSSRYAVAAEKLKSTGI